ncbi:alcohol dehydrogenase [Striga asiatica]|uniref:Alcohol dehydrogenase n=1 Tax=Striga asiatica TaxID=4170 RepID=A0A5A7NYX4_STRAF|nr:alcohol dehydrogenase [Striga asiatica]
MGSLVCLGSLINNNVVNPISRDTIGKVITCKAAVAYGPGEALVVEEIEVEVPQAMEVRIRVLFTSICHTDLSAWEGQNEAHKMFPRILGHEASGLVESVGPGVTDIGIGDHVVPIFNGECGDCAQCKSPKTNMCRKFRVDPLKGTMVNDGKSRFRTKNGSKPIYHFLNTSTFTEYTVLDSACVVKIHSDAPLGKMSLLSCGLSTGLGAAWNTADIRAGATVAVFGLGAVGLAVSEAIGITDFINPKELVKPVHEIISEMTEGGVDYSFECVGNLDVLREAFLSTHDGWGLTVILGIHQTPNLLPLHPMELFSGRRIVGSVFGDFKGKSQLPHLVVKLDEFITHEMPFENINEAMQLLRDGKSLRCLLHL